MSKTLINRLMMTIGIMIVVYGLVLFWQNRQAAPGVVVPVNTVSLGATTDKLTIKSNGGKTTLIKRDSRWFLGKKKVDSDKIKGVLDAIRDLKFIRVVSTKTKNLAAYGLDPKQSKSLKLFEKKKLLQTLVIGGTATSNSFYIKIGSDASVYEADGVLSVETGRPASYWTKSLSEEGQTKRDKSRVKNQE
ncbi:MAG TPA: DUF4340 domain-containing protein [Actinobacteria bacterium]|nr:DUF4340 domain-containing protein [Actinomycetota bacterium]